MLAPPLPAAGARARVKQAVRGLTQQPLPSLTRTAVRPADDRAARRHSLEALGREAASGARFLCALQRTDDSTAAGVRNDNLRSRGALRLRVASVGLDLAQEEVEGGEDGVNGAGEEEDAVRRARKVFAGAGELDAGAALSLELGDGRPALADDGAGVAVGDEEADGDAVGVSAVTLLLVAGIILLLSRGPLRESTVLHLAYWRGCGS